MTNARPTAARPTAARRTIRRGLAALALVLAAAPLLASTASSNGPRRSESAAGATATADLRKAGAGQKDF